MKGLVDSDVLIDIARQHPPALDWLELNGDELAVCGFTACEVLAGCASKFEARRANTLLDRFRTYWPLPLDCDRGLRRFSDLNLAHGIGFIDLLIAETAIALGATLYSFNARHFRAIPELKLEQPYER